MGDATMPRNLDHVVCIRIADTTYDKLVKLQETKFTDTKFATLIRECLILGIAKLEVDKNDK